MNKPKYQKGSVIEGVKTVGGYLPFVGTALDAYELYKNPSLEQAIWTGVGLASDVLLGGSVRAALKASRQFKNAKNTLRLVSNPLTRDIFKEGAKQSMQRNNYMRTKVIKDTGGNVVLNAAQNNTLDKYQTGGIIQDNTKVQKPQIVLPFKLSEEQKARIRQQLAQKNQGRIYDKDKADYYRNLQRAYNSNFFGFGIHGTPTHYDYTSEEGQKAIQSNFNYAKDNALSFIGDIAGTGISTGVGSIGRKILKAYNKATKGILRAPSKSGSLGSMKQYMKNYLGEGAEAVVLNNNKTSVAKMSTIPIKEMELKNNVPNTVPSKYVGYVKNGRMKLPTYIQNKVQTLTEKDYPKYIGKFDKAMEKENFRRVNDPNVQYRAYTNGKIVTDDYSPDNIGLTTGNPVLDLIFPKFLKRPMAIDFNYQTTKDWLAQGFVL